MSNDIYLAFAHPNERAAATSKSEGLDRISVRDHTVEVEIGAFQSERGTKQRVRFNIAVEVRPLVEPVEDDVDRILSYDRITEAIAAALNAERINLLETLAERVAESILLEPQAMRVFVRIEKLDRGPGSLGVEIVRSRNETAQPADAKTVATKVPHPQIVYLSNAAIQSTHLTQWIDQLVQMDQPLVICVSAPEDKAPESSAQLAQRRIDLLAIEQNAWVLAGRDKRCVVVSTRTELEWAMKNGKISVWAPSKIVLDTVDSANDMPHRAVDLALWFAKEMNAASVRLIGEDGVALDETKVLIHAVDAAVL